MQIRKASVTDVEALLPQFNAYRNFYKKAPASEEGRAFLLANLSQNRSTIYIAQDPNGKVVGFVQLYSRLSSLSMASYLYLSDLYVDENYRKHGIARALMKQAQDYGAQVGAINLQLETAHTNLPAQGLYESLGYEQDKDFRTYVLRLPVNAGVK